MPTQLDSETIAAAIEGYEAQRIRIDAKIAELRAMLSGSPAPRAGMTETMPTRKRRGFSAATKRKMALAQKNRWAKLRGESTSATESAPVAVPAKRTRRLSKAGKAAIIAATKARWAAFRAAKKASGQAAPKKAGRKKGLKASSKRAKKLAGTQTVEAGS